MITKPNEGDKCYRERDKLDRLEWLKMNNRTNTDEVKIRTDTPEISKTKKMYRGLSGLPRKNPTQNSCKWPRELGRRKKKSENRFRVEK